nr:hypothetical protein [Tanacetum cinerariifolium]
PVVRVLLGNDGGGLWGVVGEVEKAGKNGKWCYRIGGNLGEMNSGFKSWYNMEDDLVILQY